MLACQIRLDAQVLAGCILVLFRVVHFTFWKMKNDNSTVLPTGDSSVSEESDPVQFLK